MRMRRVVFGLGLVLAACRATQPTAEKETKPALDEETNTPPVGQDELLEGPGPNAMLGDFFGAVSMGYGPRRTWGNPRHPAAPQTLGQRLGQGARANLWEWTECARFYLKTSVGGPEGTGQIVRTDDAAARYRLWSLDPLTVEVEIGGHEGQPDDELHFFDQQGKSVAATDQDRLAVKAEGVETLYCDAMSTPRDRTGWLPCRELSLLTSEHTTLTTSDEQVGMVRLLEDKVIQWAMLGEHGRVGMATDLLGVECEGQDLPGVETMHGKGPRQSCSHHSYDLRRTAWKRLRPASIAATSEDCVGYCFDGFIDSVTEPGIARVIAIEDDIVLTRATVSGNRVSYWPEEKGKKVRPSRFACFDRSERKGVPHFEDCVQMPNTPKDDWACLTGTERRPEVAGYK